MLCQLPTKSLQLAQHQIEPGMESCRTPSLRRHQWLSQPTRPRGRRSKRRTPAPWQMGLRLLCPRPRLSRRPSVLSCRTPTRSRRPFPRYPWELRRGGGPVERSRALCRLHGFGEGCRGLSWVEEKSPSQPFEALTRPWLSGEFRPYGGGVGASEVKKKFACLKSTSNFGPL